MITVWLAGAYTSALADWRLVWNDEFNGVAVDSTRWTYDVGTGPPFPGWGNNELQYYTARPQNVVVTNGVLHLIARREAYKGASYTSVRLKTQGLFSKAYGRFEIRARLPQGRGYWPAFWLLPLDSVYGSWAASGEIDLMENRGQEPTTVSGTLHFGGQWPTNAHSSGPSFTFAAGDSATNFHTYALDWGTNWFRWYVDGRLYQTQASWWSSGGPFPAPFDRPFYLLMNLAVGGNFVGSPDAATVFPGRIEVDYVRVYDYSDVPVPRAHFVGVTSSGSNLVISGANGPPAGTFYVLSASHPATAASQWLRLSTNQFDAAGTFELSIPSPASNTFYRLEIP